MVDKLVSSFNGSTADLVTPEPGYIVLKYIQDQWDDNFDYSGTGTKPMLPKAEVIFFSWWKGAGKMSIDASNIYTSVQPVEIGNGLVESYTTVRIDLFARQIKTAAQPYNYPVWLYTAARFIRQLIKVNPQALTGSGIHEMTIERYADIPEQDPRSTVFHHQISVALRYMHNVVAA